MRPIWRRRSCKSIGWMDPVRCISRLVCWLAIICARNAAADDVMTSGDVRIILDAHNGLRAMQNASDMYRMMWHQGLAQAARNRSNSCELRPDVTSEEMSSAYFSRTTLLEEVVTGDRVALKRIVTKWFAILEQDICGRHCERFVSLISASTKYVGCHMSKCGNIQNAANAGDDAYLFVCYYAYPPTDLDRPFTVGPPCSNCDANATCREQLCSDHTSDDFVDDKWACPNLMPINCWALTVIDMCPNLCGVCNPADSSHRGESARKLHSISTLARRKFALPFSSFTIMTLIALSVMLAALFGAIPLSNLILQRQRGFPSAVGHADDDYEKA